MQRGNGLQDKRVVVLGGSSGIGLEVAKQAESQGASLVIASNLWQSMSAPERERLYESVGKSLPVGRVGEAHEIAQAYLFLMQEGFSTEQTVVVDGGTVLV
jgi:NAD(P)-dependent dehydrogenase (short-subunit alcohol dehydrogenase family)